MKYIYLLITVGCFAFSPVNAESAYPYAQSKSQTQGRYLSAFWKEAQLSQAFVDVFYDSSNALPIDVPAAALGFSNVIGEIIKDSLERQVVDTQKVN